MAECLVMLRSLHGVVVEARCGQKCAPRPRSAKSTHFTHSTHLSVTPRRSWKMQHQYWCMTSKIRWLAQRDRDNSGYRWFAEVLHSLSDLA